MRKKIIKKVIFAPVVVLKRDHAQILQLEGQGRRTKLFINNISFDEIAKELNNELGQSNEEVDTERH